MSYNDINFIKKITDEYTAGNVLTLMLNQGGDYPKECVDYVFSMIDKRDKVNFGVFRGIETEFFLHKTLPNFYHEKNSRFLRAQTYFTHHKDSIEECYFLKKYIKCEVVMSKVIDAMITTFITLWHEHFRSSRQSFLVFSKVVEIYLKNGGYIRNSVIDDILDAMERIDTRSYGTEEDKEGLKYGLRKVFYFIISRNIEMKFNHRRGLINALFPIDKIEKFWRRHKVRKMARQMLPIWYHPDYIGGRLAKKDLSNFFNEVNNKDNGLLSI